MTKNDFKDFWWALIIVFVLLYLSAKFTESDRQDALQQYCDNEAAPNEPVCKTLTKEK